MGKRRLFSVLAMVVVTAVALVALTNAGSSIPSVLAPRAAAVPAQPYILYLAPQGSTRGLVNDQAMQARDATRVGHWITARWSALFRPLDALLVDATLLDTMSPWDVEWLRSQFHNGVTIVGLGVDDDSFARALGLDTLRVPAEGQVPLGPTGYRLVAGLALATLDDLRAPQFWDWIGRAMRGEHDDRTMPPVRNPAVTSFGESRGTLDSERDLDALFIRLHLSIDGTYKVRSDFAEQLRKRKR